MPLSLILKRFKDFADPVLDKNGKQLRERTAEGNKIFVKKKITPADVVIFSKQFATMVKAGLPILNVLTMLRDQIEHPTMKEIIEDVR